MSDIVSIGRRVSSVNISPQFSNYSKVIIHVSDDTAYEVGNDTGRTLELDNPFGTQEMAQTILNSLTGYQYQPYEASGALLDPAAEIGDAANIRGVYGGIYTRQRGFGRLMKTDISAPQDEEINHEYQYETPEKREFTRQLDEVKASLIIANDSINAKVSQTGGTNSTFGWSLTASGHQWYAGSKKVMEVTASGLAIEGKITATSGKIGGFTIGSKAIYNNISSYGGNQSTGVYLGTDGIQLGQNFKVSPAGTVLASSIKLKGTITFLNSDGTTAGTMSAANLRSGAQSAISNGGYWSGGAAGGYSWNNTQAQNTTSRPSIFCGYVNSNSNIWCSGTVNANKFSINGGANLGTVYITSGGTTYLVIGTAV